MANSAVPIEQIAETDEEAIRRQLNTLVEDPAFRSSRRSVAFLQYVVEQTLKGAADVLKERTIGAEVFGRDPSYDTSEDHVVRTAATELRKRLAIYYGDERHRSELRIALLPGSYIPHFTLPLPEAAGLPGPGVAIHNTGLQAPQLQMRTVPPEEPAAHPGSAFRTPILYVSFALALAATAFLMAATLRRTSPQTRFWNPVLRAQVPVLIAVGDVPNGPPSMSPGEIAGSVPPSPRPGADPPAVPFPDAVTIARVTSVLTNAGKQVVIRRENASSFSDLLAGPVVLVGAFNNGWSLRLTRPLRFSLAMDPGRRLIYIRDREHPDSRVWNWSIDAHEANPNKVSSTPLHDYALISRIVNSETGHVVVVIGGLYAYGTEAAGEFLTDPQLMSLANGLPLDATRKNLQIVLETDVTQQTPGPPRIVAFASN